MPTYTWDRIEVASLDCPHLRFAVAMVDRGDITREEALIAVALQLSAGLAAARQTLVDQINRRTPQIMIVPDSVFRNMPHRFPALNDQYDQRTPDGRDG